MCVRGSTKKVNTKYVADYFCLHAYDAAELLHSRGPNENYLRTARRTLQLPWKKGLLTVCRIWILTGNKALSRT